MTRSSPSSRAPAPPGCGSFPTSRWRSRSQPTAAATYAFRIRPGIRYSDGQPLRAGDFRRAIERLFRVQSPGACYFDGHRRRRRLRPSTRPLRPLPRDRHRRRHRHRRLPPHRARSRFPVQADPVRLRGTDPARNARPRNRLSTRARHRAVPRSSASATPQIRFVRNPFFREWSHAAQPDGNPDSIVWRSMPTAQAAVTAVEHGRADWLFGLIPPAQYDQLRLQDPLSCTQAPSSPSTSCRSTPTAPRSTTFASGRRSTTRSTGHDRPAVRRPELRHANLPGDHARPARLPPLLPLHAAPPRRRGLHRPQPGARAAAGRANRARAASASTYGAPRQRLRAPRGAGVRRQRAARPRLPRPPPSRPVRQRHRGDAQAIPAVRRRRLGGRTTPTRPPTSRSSSAAAAATATATTATPRSTARCTAAELLELSDPAKAQRSLGIDRPPAHRQRHLGADRQRAGSRPRLQAPAQLRIQPRLGIPRRPSLAPKAALTDAETPSSFATPRESGRESKPSIRHDHALTMPTRREQVSGHTQISHSVVTIGRTASRRSARLTRLGVRSPGISRSLSVMRYVRWQVSGRSRTVPASPER